MAHCTLNRNVAAHFDYLFLHQIKANAMTVVAGMEGFKKPEYVSSVLVHVDTLPVILNNDPEHAFLPVGFQGDTVFSVMVPVFDRIADQVLQNALHIYFNKQYFVGLPEVGFNHSPGSFDLHLIVRFNFGKELRKAHLLLQQHAPLIVTQQDNQIIQPVE